LVITSVHMKCLEKLDRTTVEITFDPHVFTRQLERNFDLDFVEETVRTGMVVNDKCAEPNKVCFQKYHGKKKNTYFVVALFYENFIEVKTTWLTKGK